MQPTPDCRQDLEPFLAASGQDVYKARPKRSRAVLMALTRPCKPRARRPGVTQWTCPPHDPQCAGDAAANLRRPFAMNAARLL